MAELNDVDRAVMTGFLQAGFDNDEAALENAPEVVREFYEDVSVPPDWVSESDFAPGIRMFHRNSKVILASFVAGVLIEGFMTNIAKSFFITGRVRDQGVRRLQQNQSSLGGIVHPRRFGSGRRRLEVVGKTSDNPRASQTLVDRI